MTNFKNGIEHLKFICERVDNLRWAVSFTLEELAENDLSVVYPDISSTIVATNNYRTQYSNDIYLNQNLVKGAFRKSFPGAFDDYFEKLTAYNNDDACELFYSDPTQQLACQTIGIGNIAGGLVQSEVSLVGYISSTITNFYMQNPRTPAVQKDSINSKEFQDSVSILNGISPMLYGLIDEYLAAFNDYLSSQYTIQKIKFALYLVLRMGILLVVWIPYLKRLKNQIFRTKGLLNMIPMAMLKKNKNLRDIFRSNEILKAIR